MNNSILPPLIETLPDNIHQIIPDTKTSEQCQSPVVVFDMRKNRIRIHKQTLHLLGNPDYVQLLVNPHTQTIAIRCSNSRDRQAHKIKWKLIAERQCCELYSKYLLTTFCNTFIHLDCTQAYRITGKIYAKERLAYFDLKDATSIGNTEGANMYE